MSGAVLASAVPIARIPAGGKHFRVEAERGGAPRHRGEALGIVEVAELTAELDVRPVGAEAFAVRGALTASVVQTDVVTLEPVRQEVSEAIDLTLFRPQSDSPAKERGAASTSTLRDRRGARRLSRRPDRSRRDRVRASGARPRPLSAVAGRRSFRAISKMIRRPSLRLSRRSPR